PSIRFYGIPFPTRTTVIRLADGGLWLHSPIKFSTELLDKVQALGPVKHLIAPNWLHYASLGDWAAACPEATSWAAPGVLERAQNQGFALAVDHEFGPGVEVSWADEVYWHLVGGSATHREVVFFHPQTRTLVLTDLIENFEYKKMPWWLWPLLKIAGNTHPDGKMPRDLAATFNAGRAELKAAVELMLSWAPEAIIIAHGRCYECDGVGQLRRAFRALLD
ncbi:MAG: DUF4336 domain-containing protein, partial [Cellvibrionaceae bacterium]|nr:DUF4336 domain-containing protein [Cellvibrionaceae bacterium]